MSAAGCHCFDLRNVLEVFKATPIATMYFELGILPVRYEIEMRQLLFLKRILDKKHDDPCLLATRCLNLRIKRIGQICNWFTERL